MLGRVHAAALVCAASLLSACASAATGGATTGPVAMESRPADAGAQAPAAAAGAAYARVAGRLATADGRELTSGAVVLARSEGGHDLTTPGIQDVTILPDGSFVFIAVPPGEYVIRARGEVEPNGITRFASYRIRVENTNVDGLRLTLEPGAIVQGRVVVERRQASPPPSWASVRVRAPFTDGGGFGERFDGQVRRDGTFELRGIMAGPHILSLEGLPPPWVLKQVMLGGRDITTAGFTAASNRRYSDVRITITDAPASGAPDAMAGHERRH